MWGIIPAAGAGSRIQPLAFSKELLPVGSRDENGTERPRAVSEYLLERMILAGVDKVCFVISPTKTDIVQYYGARFEGADIIYVIQPAPGGLCDAIFRAAPIISTSEPVAIGLPDTIWMPSSGLAQLPDDVLSLLLFPVDRPELFDAVSCGTEGYVERIHVKQRGAPSHWIWGAVKMPGAIFHELLRMWQRPERRDEYLGTLINAWLSEGGHAVGVKAGQRYVDTGTVHGYRSAIRLLEEPARGADWARGPHERTEVADEAGAADMSPVGKNAAEAA